MIGEDEGRMKPYQVLQQALDFTKAYFQGRVFDPQQAISFLKDAHSTISELNGAPKAEPAAVASEKPTPAVSIKSSITPDYLICLHDGKRFKSLKRHLMSEFGQTPEQYRQTFGLANDYPMTAPAYSKQRSALAQQGGLGQNRKKAA